MEKQRYFYNHKSQVAKSVGLVDSNLWEWGLDPSQQRREIYQSFWNVLPSKAIKNSVDATQDEWMDSVRIKSRQRTSGPCKVIEIGILWLYYTKIRKSGEANGSKMCTKSQKSWSTTPTLDWWHHAMDWDEDQWSGCSSERSWLFYRDTTRRQLFLWRKALNDDDDHPWLSNCMSFVFTTGLMFSATDITILITLFCE